MIKAIATQALSPDALARCAALHAAGFVRPWSAASLQDTLANEAVFAVLSYGAQSGSPAAASGFGVFMLAGDVLDIVTLTVDPVQRGNGHGTAILAAALTAGQTQGAQSALLEVAANNAPAIALYEAAGFATISRRRNYYPAPPHRSAALATRSSEPVDALVMRKALA
ncbi:MAG: GNAT family N-acetyltransferase [Pseudomonadota bacterium]